MLFSLKKKISYRYILPNLKYLLSGESSISNLTLNLVPMATGLAILLRYFWQGMTNSA